MPRPAVSLDHAEAVNADAWSFPVRYGVDDEWIERRLRRASERATERAERAQERVVRPVGAARSSDARATSRRTEPRADGRRSEPALAAVSEATLAVSTLHAQAESGLGPTADQGTQATVGAPAAAPVRRTVTIRGRGAERYTPSRRRPAQPVYQRSGFRPDRAAMWAVLLGLLLVIVAATSSHAAVLHAHALLR